VKSLSPAVLDYRGIKSRVKPSQTTNSQVATAERTVAGPNQRTATDDV